MDFSVTFSELFSQDLESIVCYVSVECSPERAEFVGEKLISSALALGNAPFSGTPVKLREGIRKALFYPYLLFYEVNEESGVVEVLRIWHGSRDPKSLSL